ncbi:MAG: hypothetical protein WAN04_06515 [Candidatus Udaeobacter sp.]
MLFVPKPLVAAVAFSILAGAASIKATPQGFVEGHLKIVSLRAVEPSDDMPRQAVAPETYAEYPLIILSQDEKKEIARVAADENGNYRVPLPPGSYILDVQGRIAKRLRAKPQPFTVVPNETVHVDMTIIMGFANPPS